MMQVSKQEVQSKVRRQVSMTTRGHQEVLRLCPFHKKWKHDTEEEGEVEVEVEDEKEK